MQDDERKRLMGDIARLLSGEENLQAAEVLEGMGKDPCVCCGAAPTAGGHLVLGCLTFWTAGGDGGATTFDGGRSARLCERCAEGVSTFVQVAMHWTRTFGVSPRVLVENMMRSARIVSDCMAQCEDAGGSVPGGGTIQ